MADKERDWDFSGLRAMFFNGTLERSPAPSHTELLIRVSQGIMERHGVETEVIRTIDHDIATGVWPDMCEHGWAADEWPAIWERVQAADILVLAGPIWLGDNSSETKKVIERLYACSSLLNDRGQYAYYGKVGGCLITGNEDGLKHCAMNILYSLQHLGCTIPPQADAGWIGEAGPGPSYGDPVRSATSKTDTHHGPSDKGDPDDPGDSDDPGEDNEGESNDKTVNTRAHTDNPPAAGARTGFDNDFTNRNTTFMTWNLLHLTKLLKDAGGIPPHGNQRAAWDAGARFDFANPEYR